MTKQVFEGIKIVELTWAAVGPVSVKYLADHGATTIRVDSHTRPCVCAVSRPYKGDFMHFDSGWWRARFNTSKYSISIDVSKPKGQEIIKRLVTEWGADIFAENFAPGAVKRLGLDYESIRELKPDIIYLSTSNQGQTGPLRAQPGLGGQLSALTGFCHMSGWPDRGPVQPYGAYTDFISPRYNAAHLIAALDYQRRTGKGQYLDNSQFEAATNFLAPLIMDYAISGRIARRDGNRLLYAAPHGVYPCRGHERWVAIAVFTDEQWRAFCKAIGDPEWTKESGFATLAERKSNEDRLDRLIGEWTSNFTAEELAVLMQASGIPSSVVESTKDLFEDPQLKHRNFFRRLEWSAFGPTAFDGPCFRMSKTPENQWSPPTFGQHNDHVLRGLLGLSDDDIADLFADQVITTPEDFPLAHRGRPAATQDSK